MRQSIGTATLFKMVLIFTLIFAAFLTLTITYNRVFKLKNESISILEKYDGTTEAFKIMNNYLKSNGYSTTGICKTRYGVRNYDNPMPEDVIDGERYYYCVDFKCESSNCWLGNNNTIRYQIELFFSFNLPAFGNLGKFRITGETKSIKLYNYSQVFS